MKTSQKRRIERGEITAQSWRAGCRKVAVTTAVIGTVGSAIAVAGGPVWAVVLGGIAISAGLEEINKKNRCYKYG